MADWLKILKEYIDTLETNLGDASGDNLTSIVSKFGDDTDTLKARLDALDAAIALLATATDMATALANIGDASGDTLTSIVAKLGDDAVTVKARLDALDSAVALQATAIDLATAQGDITAIKAVTDVLPDAGALTSLAQDLTVAKEATLTALNTEVESTSLDTGEGTVTNASRLGKLARWIADILNDGTNGLAALLTAIQAVDTSAQKTQAGKTQSFTKNITSAANVGAVTVATVTTQAVRIKSIVVRSNGALTADLTNITITGGAGAVVTFIDAVTGVRANIAAADQQVSWDGSVTLAATKTIVITLTGTGATAVDLQVDIGLEAITDGGYLV